MNRGIELLQEIDNPALSKNERVMLRCSLATELEQQGSYEAARNALGQWWPGLGERPAADGLAPLVAAELFLRVGTLSGWLGSAAQTSGAQEEAKNLLTEAQERFVACEQPLKVAEAQVELAYCYCREGAYSESRLFLREAIIALNKQPHSCAELSVTAYVRSAIVERMENRLHEALSFLNNVPPLLDVVENDLLKGNFYNTLANVLKNLGVNERRPDYTERAFIDYAAASYHFERAGHVRYRAVVENNLGLLYLAEHRPVEALEHVERARRLAYSLKDRYWTAQFDESRAQVYLVQGRASDAERAARSAVRALEQGGEQSTLAETLITLGKALARLGRESAALTSFRQAMEIAQSAGDLECAGRAALTLTEELAHTISENDLREYFSIAEDYLSKTQHAETRDRLLRCAKLIINFRDARKAPQSQSAPIFIYKSESTKKLLQFVERIAVTDKTVLITGETGTGKDLIARLIHDWSNRPGKLVTINCSTLVESLVESQLFGHRMGSFTGALADYAGAVAEATGGTLFLDEIGELSLLMQAKLLRLVEHKEILPIGAPTAERVDVRIIAATNKNLRDSVARREFREDLYYRLYTAHIEMEPLRARREDAKAIALHLVKELVEVHRKQVVFMPDSIDALCQLTLRGNVRELRALLEKTILSADEGQIITTQDVETFALQKLGQQANLAEPWRGCSLQKEVREFEEQLIRKALEAANGSITKASQLLGVSHQGLSYILSGRHQKLCQTSAGLSGQKRKRTILTSR